MGLHALNAMARSFLIFKLHMAVIEGGTKLNTFYTETPKQPDYFMTLLMGG